MTKIAVLSLLLLLLLLSNIHAQKVDVDGWQLQPIPAPSGLQINIAPAVAEAFLQMKFSTRSSRLDKLYHVIGLQRTPLEQTDNPFQALCSLFHDICRLYSLLGPKQLQTDYRCPNVVPAVANGQHCRQVPTDLDQAISQIDNHVNQLYRVVGLN